jgi:hypothetical protein
VRRRSKKEKELAARFSAILDKFNRVLQAGDVALIKEWEGKYKEIFYAESAFSQFQRLSVSDRTPAKCYEVFQTMGKYAHYLDSHYLKLAKEYEAQLEWETVGVVI